MVALYFCLRSSTISAGVMRRSWLGCGRPEPGEAVLRSSRPCDGPLPRYGYYNVRSEDVPEEWPDPRYRAALRPPAWAAATELRHRVFHDLDAGFHVGRGVGGVGLVLDADVPLELDLPQRLEHGEDVEDSLAVDHVGLLLVVVILEVHAEVARAHRAHLRRRIEFLTELAGSHEVAGVEAGADQLVVVLHRLHDDRGGIPAVQLVVDGGPVRVDADGDLVLLAELVEGVETVGLGIGAEAADAERLTELEDLPRFVLV